MSRIVTCDHASRRRRKSERAQSCFITPSERSLRIRGTRSTDETDNRICEQASRIGRRRDHRDPSSTGFGILRVIGHAAFPPRVTHVTPSERASERAFPVNAARFQMEVYRDTDDHSRHEDIPRFSGEPVRVRRERNREGENGRKGSPFPIVPSTWTRLSASSSPFPSFPPFSPLSLPPIQQDFILHVNYRNFVESREIFFVNVRSILDTRQNLPKFRGKISRVVCVNYAQNLNRIADLIVPSSRTILEFHVPPRNAHVNLNVSRCLLKKIYVLISISYACLQICITNLYVRGWTGRVFYVETELFRFKY